MTAQEILEGITRHRACPLNVELFQDATEAQELQRKSNEIEWALQAMAEKLVDLEASNTSGHA